MGVSKTGLDEAHLRNLEGEVTRETTRAARRTHKGSTAAHGLIPTPTKTRPSPYPSLDDCVSVRKMRE